MEGVIGFEPLVDSVDLPPKNEAVDVSRNERVDERIKHNQVAVHAHVKTTDQIRFDWKLIITDTTDQFLCTMKLD